MSQIKTWLDFALQQIAAESYIDEFISGELSLIDVLKLGANDKDFDPTGATRMTETQADVFVQRYQIVDHYKNDASGFSATFLFDTQTQKYTLSFRSTEYKNAGEGGDFERDGRGGADGEIFNKGFAFGQIAAMEEYFANLSQGVLAKDGLVNANVQAFFQNPTNKINITGYSLGAHLANVFTQLHAERVNHTYVYNAAGTGLTGNLSLQEVIDNYQAIYDNPQLVTSLPGYLNRKAELDNLLFQIQANEGTVYTNLYESPRHQLAALVASWDTTSILALETLKLANPNLTFAAPNPLITSIYGHAVQSDNEMVANSGVNIPATPIYIEDQPNIRGLSGATEWLRKIAPGDYGETHSITLLVDALSLMDVFNIIDPTLTIEKAGHLFQAASNTYAAFGTPSKAEGDSLEKAMDSLRKLLLGEDVPTTNSSNAGGSFGSLTFREPFYENLAQLKTTAEGIAGQYTIVDISSSEGDQIALKAKQDNDEGLAYRYALKMLNPFVLLGNADIYTAHNTNGELDLYAEDTGKGLTKEYLADRADFLSHKAQLNLADTATLQLPNKSDNWTYADETTEYILEAKRPSVGIYDALVDEHKVIFGSEDNDTDSLIGDKASDYIYGEGGADTIDAKAGNDYLEAGLGDDTLKGGKGNDILDGGAGNDTYAFVTGDGLDTIRDQDGSGQISIGGQTLTGAEKILDNLWKDDEKKVIYSLLQQDGKQNLVIRHAADRIIIEDFTNGDLGINLAGAPLPPDTSTYSQKFGTENADIDLTPDAPNQKVYALAGNDRIIANQPNTIVLAGLGDDIVRNGAGEQKLYGEEGRDILIATTGEDELFGGLDDDALQGGADDDYMEGNEGADVLAGGTGSDVLIGGIGDDILLGGGGIEADNRNWSISTTWTDTRATTNYNEFIGPYSMADDGTDIVKGEAGRDIIHGGENDDYLDGGDDNDFIQGDSENDTLFGGAGDDALNGDGTDDPTFTGEVYTLAEYHGADYLDGGEGNDELTGDGADDELFGGSGNDTLMGDHTFLGIAFHGKDYLDGGDGADKLFGHGNDDQLFGGTGLDELQGGLGADYLDGEADDDKLFGEAGSDELFGGEGADELSGGDDADYLDGEDGDDLILGDAGQDQLFGGEGSDQLQGGLDDDYLDGEAGDDTLLGEAGKDILLGGAGIDELQGGEDDDKLFGGTGNDVLAGDVGADTLQGDSGNDTLLGGEGDDIYIINAADGQDVIDDTQGLNKIKFGAGITPTSLKASIALGSDGGKYLFIDYSATDYIGIKNGFNGNSIRLYEFADGTILTHTELLNNYSTQAYNQTGTGDSDILAGSAFNDTLNGAEGDDQINAGLGDDLIVGGGGSDILGGGGGNDTLHGDTGNNLLIGGAGNDNLTAKEGSDTYLFNAGFGQDIITEIGEVNQAVDVIQFGAGITPDMVTASNVGGSLFLNVAGTQDQVKITSYFALANNAYQIEQIKFTDSEEIWDDAKIKQLVLASAATEGDDTIFGFEADDVIDGLGGNDSIQAAAGNDTLRGSAGSDSLYGEAGSDDLDGGAGNNTLYGGLGSDTYHFNLGSSDTIWEFEIDGSPNTDIIKFGAAINPETTKVTREIKDLLFTFEGNNGVLRVKDFFKSGTDNFKIERVEFIDGTVWTIPILRAFFETPTAGADTLEGYDDTGDTLNGLAGADTLSGLGGNDTLDGGTQKDQLMGGAGNDTYLLNRNSGTDTILESSGTDTIKLSADILPADVNLYRHADDLVLVVNPIAGQPASQYWVTNHFGSTNNQIEQIEFNNGTIWNAAEIATRTLTGAQNAQTGTTGNDTFIVDNIFDTITEAASAGTDTVQSRVNFMLPQNIENITLTQNLSTTATGNALNNVITGNAGDNALYGVDGNDTLNGNEGDDILDGGTGTNTLRGGRGDDLYYSNGLDTIVENANEGIDTIIASVSTTLSANVENLTLMGTDAINGTGNELDNIITGNRGGNVIDGGLGADTMIGLSDPFDNDNDTYLVDNVGDKVIEAQNGGIDTIRTSVSYTLSANVENIILTGSAAINAAGNDGFNKLDGTQNAAANRLTGGKGNDTYLVGNGDTVIELADEGVYDIVEIRTNVQGDYQASQFANIENIILDDNTGTSNITGSAADDILSGNSFSNQLSGGDGNDVISAGGGNDTVIGDAGADYLLGGNQDDNLQGGADSDRLYGENGNDTLDGGTGADEMVGGAGLDTYFVDDINDAVGEGVNGGSDTVKSTISYTLGDNVENLTLLGTDNLNATGNTAGNNLIGNSGNNQIIGNVGTDQLEGGAGTDTLIGGTEADLYVFNLGDGQDTIQENDSNSNVDMIVFRNPITPSNVTLEEVGDDLLIRYSATDQITVKDWFLSETHRIERIEFQDGTVWNAQMIDAILTGVITGTSGDDILNGTTQDDTLIGLGGNDILDGKQGADQMTGGTGNDTYFVDNVGDVVTENASEGTDTVNSAITYTLGANLENLTLNGTAAINAIGNSLNNTLQGNSADNRLDGGTGTDTMRGAAGNDTYVVNVSGDVIVENASEGTDTVESSVTYTLGSNLENLILTGSTAINGTGNSLNNTLQGNSAVNTLSGGTGNDTYIIGSGDIVTENSSSGTDTVIADFTYTLGSNLENLTLSGTGNINGTGNSSANTIIGNSGNNSISGGSGADSLRGGAGNDTYTVDNTGDVIVENANEGTDLVNSSVTYTLSANVENITLTGTSTINATGNSSDNVITGNSAVNTLTGGAGNDTLDGLGGNDALRGGTGDDTYIFGTGDTITENANEGTDTVRTGATFTLGSNLENLILTGTGTINGTGNTLNNVITGNSANNTLIGNAGNDTLNGNGGTDTLRGGTGDDIYFVDGTSDIVTENASEGTDTVNSSVTLTLGSNVENLNLSGTGAINGTGNTLNNVINGNSGNNTLLGNSGNDTLDGKAGIDTLNGGTGNDTYLFGRGDGQDSLQNYNVSTGNPETDAGTTLDRLQFKTGVNPADIQVTRNSNDLVLSIVNTTDAITLKNYFQNTQIKLDEIRFEDGTTWTPQTIDDILNPPAAQMLNNEASEIDNDTSDFNTRFNLDWLQDTGNSPATTEPVKMSEADIRTLARVQYLVQVMATFDAQPMGQTSATPDYHDQIMPIISVGDGS